MKELRSVKTSQGYANVEFDFDAKCVRWLDDSKIFRNRQAAHQRRERLEKQMVEQSLIFYSIPWDGPTAGIVQAGAHTYELRDNGHGGYGATELSDEELEQHGDNMIELNQDEVDLDIDKVIEAIDLD